jgi:hypothetical protein
MKSKKGFSYPENDIFGLIVPLEISFRKSKILDQDQDQTTVDQTECKDWNQT